MKCLKKHVKEEIIMWWHMHFFSKCPKIKNVHFLFFDWNASLSKCPTSLCSIYLTCPIFPFDSMNRKVGHFKLNFAFKSGKFWEKTKKMNRKWISLIFGHFEKTHISYIIIDDLIRYSGHIYVVAILIDWLYSNIMITDFVLLECLLLKNENLKSL